MAGAKEAAESAADEWDDSPRGTSPQASHSRAEARASRATHFTSVLGEQGGVEDLM
jgi:hypothetical protein